MIISRISESFVRIIGLRFWILFFALCLLYATHSFAETAHIDKKTGFIFPQSIGVFNFDNKREYDDPRLGYGLNYRSQNKILLTVIVYDLGLNDIQDGTDGPKVRAQFNEAKKDIREAVRQGYYRSVEPLSNLNGFPSSFLRASYDAVRKDDIPIRTHIFIRGQKNHFVKIRATGQNSEFIDFEVSNFLDQLLMKIGLSKQIQKTQ